MTFSDRADLSDVRTKMNHAIDRVVDVRNFGAEPDSDITTALQAAVEASMYNGGGPVYFPVKGCALSDTIHVGYGTNFRGGILRGAGMAYRTEDGSNVGVGITSSVTDRPAIAVQGGRNAKLEAFSLKGPAFDEIVALFVGGNTRALIDPATWDAALTSAGVTPGRRYAPHAGVAIDPYSGDRPGTSYPDVAYPSFLGSVSQYGKGSSSNTRVRECAIMGFEVGLANQPSDYDGGGDFTDMRDSVIEYCKYGVSIGNSQARSTDLSGINFNRLHTLITTNTHGKQIGQISSTLLNGHVAGYCTQIFKLGEGAYSKTLTLQGWVCESLFRIGEMSGLAGSPDLAVAIKESSINISNMADEARAGALIVGDFNDEVIIENTEIRIERVASFPKGRVTVSNSRVVPYTEPAKAYEALAMNCLSGGWITDPTINQPFVARMVAYDANDMGSEGLGRTDAAWKYTAKETCIPHACVEGRCKSSGEWRAKRMYVGQVSASKLLSVSRSDRAITLTNDDMDTVDEAYRKGWLPGCVWLHRPTGTVLFVRSADTATGVTVLEMQNNYYFDGTNYQILDNGFDPDTADFYCFNALTYSPEYLLFGTLTEGSNVITDVKDVLGNSSTVANYGLAVGDRFADECYQQRTFTGSNALSITAIDTAAGTITMAGNARYSGRIALPWWYRQPPANETTR